MLISATNITQWALNNRRDAQNTLPEVVRLLILESDPKARKVDIPSGDSVALPGLDGVVVSEAGFFPDQFLPEGESVWEFGTDQNVGTKVNKDYAKRTNDKKLKGKRNITYVAVSPHAWIKKETWASGKKKERKWRSVKALNAEDLAQWLDRCPQTRDWFASTYLGLPLDTLASQVLPVLLLTGGWDTTYESDKSVAQEIAGIPHEAIEARLQQFSKDRNAIGSSLFKKEGSRWKLLRPELTWSIAEDCITEDTFRRFFAQVEAAFSAIPADYIAPGERTSYLIHHVGEGFSTPLKEGLADALARIATSDKRESPGYSGKPPQVWVNRCLRNIFRDENKYNPAFWVCAAPYLEILGEAWDDELLDCLEDVLNKKPEALGHIFQVPQYSLSFSVSYGLLSALQNLAWHPPYLGRVASILLALRQFESTSTKDSGPMRTFQELFVGWYANTAATLEDQRKILTRLLESEPDLGWPLLMAILPNSYTIVVCRSEPKYRDWANGHSKHPSQSEYPTYIREVWKLAIRFANGSTSRWGDLLEQVDEFRGTDLFEMFGVAFEQNIKNLQGDTTTLWGQGIKLISKHKRFPNSNWALSAAELQHLEKLTSQLKPTDLKKLYKPLFTEYSMDLYDDSLEDEHEEFETMEQVIQNRRQAAIRNLLDQLSNEEFVNYVQELINLKHDAAYHFTISLSKIINLDEQRPTELIISLLSHEIDRLKFLAANTLANILRIHGQERMLDWVDEASKYLDSRSTAILYSIFSPEEAIWQRVSSAGEDVEREYWEVFNPSPQYCKVSGESLVAKFLINAQPAKAIDCLYWQLYDKQFLSPSLIIEAFNLYLATPTIQLSSDVQLCSYEIERLVEYLESSELTETQRSQLVQLEWLLFPLLEHRSKRFNLSLFDMMAKEPNIFIDLIKILYIPDGVKERPEPDESKKAIAERAFSVLEEWSSLPGEKDGIIDATELFSWYETGLAMAKAVDREKVFNIKFGAMLGRCSISGSDGHWPHEAVRTLLEKPIEELHRSFLLGKSHSIFGKMRSVSDETRRQDLDLAKELRESSKKIASEYWIPASLLIKIATNLEEHWKSKIFHE